MSPKPLLVVGLTAFLTGGTPADAHLDFANVTPLASPAGPGSAEPNLALGPGGRVYLSWIELAADSAHQLRFSVLQGERFTPARTIATGAKGEWFVNWADFPSLLALNNKQLVAHWLQRSGMGRYAYGVRVARSNDGGVTWSEPVTPHRDESESEHGFVSLFKVGNQVGIAWLDGRKHAAAKSEAAAEMSVRFTTLTNNEALGEDVELDPRACDCCQTAAAITNKGPVLVYRDRSENEVRDISIVRYRMGLWSEPRTVHRDNWVIAACPVNGPAVAARGNRVAVAWFTGANNEARVLVAFSDNAGAKFKDPIRVDEGNPAGRVDVQFMGDNSVLVSWLERTENRADVMVRRIYTNGRSSAATTIATSSAERASGFPHMIWRGKDVVFAWTEPGRPAQVKAALLELK
jgi:hypothetical protein